MTHRRTHAVAELDKALKLLDEINETPLSQLKAKLHQIDMAVATAKFALTLESRSENNSGMGA